MHTISKIIKQKFLLVLWLIVVSFLSLSPPDDIPEVDFNIPFLDKFVHWGMYFGVSFLLSPLWEIKRYWFVKVVLAGSIIGITMEGIQYILPYERSADVWDMVANCTGAVCGLIAYKYLKDIPLYKYIFC